MDPEYTLQLFVILHFMKKIRNISEGEMIAVFLQTEINSNRWSSNILSLLDKDGKSRTIIDKPDLANTEENNYRKKLLGDFRGYGRNEELFTDFPNDVTWIRAKLNREELAKIKYMDFSYWNELSNHTRLAKIGAEIIKTGKTIFNQSNEGFIKAAEAVKQGVPFPEMILISKDKQSELVVLEGHQRITAYLLSSEYMPKELEVIIGYSKDMGQWGGY